MANRTSPARAPQGLDESITGGSGEPPTVSATPSVVNAIHDATWSDLTHTPVPPEHIAGAPPR